jgi:hypothetical protein
MELSNIHVLSLRGRNSLITISITWSSDKQYKVKSLEQTTQFTVAGYSVNLLQWQKFVQFHTSLVFRSHNLQLLLQNHTKE